MSGFPRYQASRARVVLSWLNACARARFLCTLSIVALGVPTAIHANDYRSETVIAKDRHSVEASAAASHLDTEDARVGNVDTAQILTRIPDLKVRRSGGLNGPAYLSVRGADPNATHFSLDGVPIHGATNDVLDINTLMPEMLGQVDVYRTTLPVALGAPAPGGLVDLRLRDTSEPEAWAVGSYGSWQTRKIAAAGTIPVGDGHVRLAASYRGARGDYRFYNTNGTDRNPLDDNPNERRVNNDYEQGSILLLRDQQVDDWHLRFISLTTLLESGVPGIDIAQSRYARRSRVQQFFAIHGKTRIGDGGHTDLSTTGSLAVTNSTYHDRKGEIGLGRQDRADDQILGFLAFRTASWLPENFSVHTVFDMQLEGYHPVDRIAPVIIHRASRFVPSLGVEGRWEHPSERIAVATGLRYHHYIQRNHARDVPAAPRKHTDNPAFSPQVGLTLKPVKTDNVELQLFGYLSRTHRQPKFSELFGDNGSTVGNPDLVMEKQTGAEGGMQLTTEFGAYKLTFRGSAWKHWRQDAIEYVVMPIGVRKPFNVDGAVVIGQEFGVSLQSPHLYIELGAAHLDSKNKSSNPQEYGKKLPLRSPWSATVELRAQPIPWKALQNLSVETIVRYDAPFYADLRNNREYPDRIEWDVAIGYKMPFRNGPTIRAEALNILNRRVTTLPGRDGGEDVRITKPISDFAGYPRPGRSFYISLSWALEKEG